MRPSVPRMTKIIWDDFAPRYEYPESMRKLEEYMKKSGRNYGKYVEQHPDEPRKPIAEGEKRPFTRNCRTCGKSFAPKLLADGYTVSKQARCNDCINEERIKQGKCKIGERVVICKWCEKEIVGAIGGQKYHEECKKEMLRKKRKDAYEMKKV